MIKLAIVEDEALEREALAAQARRFFQERGEAFSLGLFEGAEAFLAQAQSAWDILLLDIQMPGMDGLSLARRLREDREGWGEAPIIFVTNLLDCAIAGYGVEALGFVPKPANYEDIRLELDKAMRRLCRGERATLELRLADGLHVLKTRDIYYMETQGHRVLIHSANGELSYLKSMGAMEQQLSGQSFFRCHTSYLVNLAHVERLGEGEVRVHGALLPVSRHRRRDFGKALTQYLREHRI